MGEGAEARTAEANSEDWGMSDYDRIYWLGWMFGFAIGLVVGVVLGQKLG